MGKPASLNRKNFFQFISFTTGILLCCFPMMYFLMEKMYAKDLDELIEYRSKEFISERLPAFTTEDIAMWNKYNEDISILPFSKSYPLDEFVQQPFFSHAEGHHVDYRSIYSEISIDNQSYILESRVPMIESHDLLGMLITQYGVLFLVLTISLSIVYIYIPKRLWRPFYTTLDKIDRFNLESGDIPEFDPTDITEFTRLNQRLERLIKENIGVYQQQKEFVENASHELQTPLAVFQSQLDMLFQQPDMSEAQIEIIQSLYAVSSRMSRLNKNLLLLAKIDNEMFREHRKIEFVNTFYELLLPLREMAESNQIKVSVTVNSAITVDANPILLESLINNLIVNSIRHNTSENGMIHIRIEEDAFEIANTGKNIPLDPDKIFRRFNRTSEEKKGNGLGLSIIRRICTLHNWEVDYAFTDRMHRFRVRFNSLPTKKKQ